MSKKQIVGSILIIIILSLICMFIYNKYKVEVETSLIVEESETNNKELSLYYTESSINYYLYGLGDIIVDFNDHTISLDKALETRQINMDEVIEIIGDKNPVSYRDGGSTKINNNDISLLQCSTTEGNKDYYFGLRDMEYLDGFCVTKPYVCSFIRTYLVLDISDSNDQSYKYLTLKSFQGEEVVTVKVDSILTSEVMEDNYYEFSFHSRGNVSEDTIESIFENYELVSVNSTNRIGNNQINEDICR